MAWTVTKERGVNNSFRWIYKTEVAAGAESDVLEIPSYNYLSVTLDPTAGATGTLHFATNEKADLAAPDWETDSEMTDVSAIKTESVHGVITAVKVAAVDAAVAARVLLR